ncbi:MAG: SDR family NAD(P)-dependent oxidoreductase [Planctomycetes bacterium]|nr:SDR family NAD(P)-dependent oxidoreductase [Planctomycetota bacterium]
MRADVTQLRGSRVLVTGASSGIGAATAVEAARKGARVILWARGADGLYATAKVCAAVGGEASVFLVDLTDASAVAGAAQTVRDQGGPPDVIVNNAGAGRWLAVEESTAREAVDAMAAPYFAAFYATREFLPAMIARRSGHIVNVTSPAAFVPVPGATTYSVARWAMRGFNEQLVSELAGTGVRVTLACPGVVASPYFAHNPGADERIPRIVSKLSRTVTPEEVGRAIVWGIERNRRRVVTPFSLKLMLGLNAMMPRTVAWLMRRTGWHRGGA